MDWLDINTTVATAIVIVSTVAVVALLFAWQTIREKRK